jgi:hypothetical protein
VREASVHAVLKHVGLISMAIVGRSIGLGCSACLVIHIPLLRSNLPLPLHISLSFAIVSKIKGLSTPNLQHEDDE